MSRPTIVVNENAALITAVRHEIEQYGPLCCLNHLDVSGVSNMNGIFRDSVFNGNISSWDVSNVFTMTSMFENSRFNGDISKWTTPRLVEASYLFQNSPFNGDISNWKVTSLEKMACMFTNSAFDGDLSKWNPHRALKKEHMHLIFKDSPYSRDLSHWVVPDVWSLRHAFSPIFRGILPVSLAPISKAFYKEIFGGAHLFEEYLRTATFGGAHFDALRLSDSKPDWAQREDYRWAIELSKLGASVGMNDNDLRKYAVRQYALLNAGGALVVDDLYNVGDLISA